MSSVEGEKNPPKLPKKEKALTADHAKKSTAPKGGKKKKKRLLPSKPGGKGS